MDTYQTFSSIIDALGGSSALAQIIGRPLGSASAMKTRGVIPPAHWPAVVQGAEEAGLAGVTHELLSKLYNARRTTRPPKSPPASPPASRRRAA